MKFKIQNSKFKRASFFTFAFLLFTFFTQAQVITDTADLRTVINATIVPNAVGGITATKLNRILIGTLNSLTPDTSTANTGLATLYQNAKKWGKAGNTGTTASDFIGTTDSIHAFQGRLYGNSAWYVGQNYTELSSSPLALPTWPGLGLTSIGYKANQGLINKELAGTYTGLGASTGFGNTAVGSYAATHIGDKIDEDSAQKVAQGTFIGNLAAHNLQYGRSGDYGRTVAIGQLALFTAVSAQGSTVIGNNSQERASKGMNNTSIGTHSLRTIVNGSNNTAVGNTSGYYSTGIIDAVNVTAGGSGYTTATVTITAPRTYAQPNMPFVNETTATATAVLSGGAVVGITITNPGAGYSDTYSTTFTHGTNNPPTVTITGDGTGATATAVVVNANNNTYVGYLSNWAHKGGYANTAIGTTTGNSEIRYKDTTTNLFGAFSQVLTSLPKTTNIKNATAIGAYTQLAQSNTVILGDSAQSTKVGIGTSLPDSLLTVTQGIWGKRGVRFSGLIPTALDTTNYKIAAVNNSTGDMVKMYWPGTMFLGISGGTMLGHILATDNTYDIGASGATRFRSGYFGTNLIAGAGLAVGVGSIDASAVVDFTSTTKGALLPRMTKTQRDAISSPATGLMVYQTDNTPGLRVYNGTNWMRYTETAD